MKPNPLREVPDDSIVLPQCRSSSTAIHCALNVQTSLAEHVCVELFRDDNPIAGHAASHADTHTATLSCGQSSGWIIQDFA